MPIHHSPYLTYICCSLLTSPFDWTQAFDRALKDVIKTLPNRPSSETADEVVSFFRSVKPLTYLMHTRIITVLTSAHLGNSHVTLELSDPHTLTEWFPLREL